MKPLNRYAATLKPGSRKVVAGVERMEERTLMTAGLTDPTAIKALAAEAYVWGLAPEFTQRFSTYNTTIGAPVNTLDYVSTPAAWNNGATNAGDSSVMYINSFVDFSKTPALMLTVPPSSSQFYVAAYLDDYLNTIGSIGTRTTPSDATTSYLLVGPNSPYAKMKSVDIHGHRYGVMASDTNLNWMLIRIATNSLADPSDSESVPSVTESVVQKFALNPLKQFVRNGFQPVFPADFTNPPPTSAQTSAAAPFKNTPTQAVAFFKQLGTSVKHNPVPTRATGLSGTALKRLPSWTVPQYGAKVRYTVPSAGQQGILRAFSPIGLTKHGFRIPKDWGPAQLQALQEGYEAGQNAMNTLLADDTAKSGTNYWSILNTIIGTYPNNQVGYLIRSAVVLNGGSANVPADAVYPTMSTYQGSNRLDGNNTYSLTFTPPNTSGTALPTDGTFPPLAQNSNGEPPGFWSVVLYQPDASEVAAPYLSQASVLNTTYSTTDLSVLSVSDATNTMTVSAPTWGNLFASTPILFGSNAAAYGLQPNTVYYVAGAPVATVDPTTRQTTYSFSISQQWIQTLSPGNVPIQYSGSPGPIADLLSPSGAGALTYGMVKPVSQLGSAQLTAGQLALNADGSLTIWFAPSLPDGVAASNWIPTPSTAYFNTLYPGSGVSTTLQIMLRMYDPTPGDTPPSILPYGQGPNGLPESYIPPALVQVS